MNERLRLPSPPASLRYLSHAQSDVVDAMYSKRSKGYCPTCSDTKVFRWYTVPQDRNTQDVSEYECVCTDQFRLYRRFLYSGIMETYQRLDWHDFMDPASIDMIEACMAYVENAHENISAGLSLGLLGDRGTGKTMAAYLLGKELVLAGHDVYCQTFNDLIDSFASGWGDKAKKEWFDKRVRSASVLVIDDLGRENRQGKGEELGQRTLEGLLRYRVQRMLPTIFTSNLSLDQIEQGYGGNSMSLLSEQMLPVEVHGSDFRSQSRQRKQAEREAGIIRPVLQ